MSNSDRIEMRHGSTCGAQRRFRLDIVFATLTAMLGWGALGIEFHRSVSESLGRGRSLAEALFLYFRYFTILTNIGIASLMSVTAVFLAIRRPPPAPGVFNAGLIYILVTCVTYELMLRHQWRPHGLQLATDMAIHDVVPALVLMFWLGFAPRNGARWRDALWTLAYPAAYFVMTLAAGALGQGYPYSFLDVDELGLANVLVVAALFLAIFYVLGLTATGLSMAWARSRRTRS